MELNKKRRYRKRIKIQNQEQCNKQDSELHILEEHSTDTSEENVEDAIDCINDISDKFRSCSDNKSEQDNKILNSDGTSSDEEVMDIKEQDIQEIQLIQEWVLSNNVPHNHVDKLLKILKRRLLPSIPKTTKTLLRCTVDYSNIQEMSVSDGSVGEFKYIGIKEEIINKVDLHLHESIHMKVQSTSKSAHGAEVLASKSNGSNMVKPSSRSSLDVSQSSLSGCELSSLHDNPSFTAKEMDPLEPQILDCANIDDTIMKAPIEMNNVEVKTPFEAAVLMRLDHLCAEVAFLRFEVSSLKSAQVTTSNYSTDKKLVAKSTSDLDQKYNIKLPLATYPEFQELENKLSSDNYLKQDIYIELKSCLDKDYNTSRSIVNMLKRFFSKQLALQFTAIRASPQNKNKFRFKPTVLCSLMEAVITRYRKEKGLRIEPEDYNNSLTDVIGNVPRWK